jgi:putative NADH-flavin reductase
MRVLIIGATGPTGRELVRQAREKGHAVSALVRRPEAASGLSGVRLIKGDLLVASTLGEALHDQDAVLSAVGTKLSRKPTTLLSDGARNLVAAMEREGPRRLICITGIGAGDSRGHGSFAYNWLVMPLLLSEIYKDKTRQEAVIQASSLDWTIVRPAELTDGPATGAYRVATDLSGFVGSKISRADVAGFMLKQLDSAEYLRRLPAISN